MSANKNNQNCIQCWISHILVILSKTAKFEKNYGNGIGDIQFTNQWNILDLVI